MPTDPRNAIRVRPGVGELLRRDESDRGCAEERRGEIVMDEFTGLDRKPAPVCRLCGDASTNLKEGLCEQCYLGEQDTDPELRINEDLYN